MSETQQVTFRIQTDLISRLEQYAQYLNQLTPGLNATRVDALRILLVRGLEQVEPTYKTTSTKARGASRTGTALAAKKTTKKKEEAK